MASSSSREEPSSRPNFRSHYYEKVGFRGVDERRALDKLLGDDPVSVEKLCNFALKCSSVPASDRLLVWKLILGISSRFGGNRASGWEWKTRSFHDCLRSVEHLTTSGHYHTELDKLASLWRLTTGRMRPLAAPSIGGGGGGEKGFASIVGYLLTVCNSSVEAFHIARAVRDRLDVDKEVLHDLAAFYHKAMASRPETKRLHCHCRDIGLNSELPFADWISTAFTGVFRTASLCKVIDKVVAGSLKVLVYLAMSLVERNAKALMECEDAFRAVVCIGSAREESEAVVVQAALDRWARDGRQLTVQRNFQSNGVPPSV